MYEKYKNIIKSIIATFIIVFILNGIGFDIIYSFIYAFAVMILPQIIQDKNIPFIFKLFFTIFYGTLSIFIIYYLEGYNRPLQSYLNILFLVVIVSIIVNIVKNIKNKNKK